MLKSINPANGEIIAEYPEHTPAELDSAAREAASAQSQWRDLPFAGRAAILKKAAALLRQRRDDYGRLMTAEMGKPVVQGRAEAEKCGWVCDYYADNASSMLYPEPVATDAGSSYVRFDPLGVILAIMPWNFPFWQLFRCAAPILMAGNGLILKHASNVSGCALAIEQLFSEAGLPAGLFRTVLVRGDGVSRLIDHPLVRGVTLTGSTPAGREVAALAGALIKKSVLELGGSDPYLILPDADLDLAAASCASSRIINSGQSCIAAKRFIVHRAVYDEFVARFTREMAGKKMGDPRDESTDIGPLARLDLRDELHNQVRQSIAQGARILVGGEIPPGPGAWYPPTVLCDVTPEMTAFTEELFGPVAAITPAEDVEMMVELANRSAFGLGAAIYSRDIGRAEALAEKIQSGSVFINALVKSDPRLPFGGVKESGYGRELAHYGIKEFVNIKTVYIK